MGETPRAEWKGLKSLLYSILYLPAVFLKSFLLQDVPTGYLI